MKRDFDLIRTIMMEAQSFEPNQGYIKFIYDDEDIRAVDEHCALLIEAGLLNGVVTINDDSGIIKKVKVRGISWEGHNFIDAAKNDNLWDKAKSTILNGATGITFGLLQKWLESQIGTDIGIPNGS